MAKSEEYQVVPGEKVGEKGKFRRAYEKIKEGRRGRAAEEAGAGVVKGGKALKRFAGEEIGSRRTAAELARLSRAKAAGAIAIAKARRPAARRLPRVPAGVRAGARELVTGMFQAGARRGMYLPPTMRVTKREIYLPSQESLGRYYLPRVASQQPFNPPAFPSLYGGLSRQGLMQSNPWQRQAQMLTRLRSLGTIGFGRPLR